MHPYDLGVGSRIQQGVDDNRSLPFGHRIERNIAGQQAD
jgi:hypothetical protein